MYSLSDILDLPIKAHPNPDNKYYAFTILSNEVGELELFRQTLWVGFTEENPPREIRQARLVRADEMLERWRSIEEPGLVVNDTGDFAIFYAFGGHAVVEKSVADSLVPEWIAPDVSVNVGMFGFASQKTLPASAMRRAPTPKCRMSIIQRDNFRCRVCGRSPNDHVDLELHVHHIRPWALGGVTERSNLITLCHTCHNGLDPHFEFSLFKLLPKGEITNRAAAYRRKLEQYQAILSSRSKGHGA